MKIAIITNIPDGNSPMFSSYVQYAKSGENLVYTSSRFTLNSFLLNFSDSHNFIYGQKFKFQYLYIPIILFILPVILLKFVSQLDDYKKRNRFKNSYKFIKDITILIKSLLNDVYLNIRHFLFLVKIKPDVVVSLCVGSCISTRVYKFFKNVPYIYSIYEVYPNHNPNHESLFLQKFYRTVIEKIAVENASLVFSPTNDKLGRLVKLRYKKCDLRIVSLYFSHKIKINYPNNQLSYPLKLYYHGIIDDQRKLPAFIEALSYIDSSKLKFYIRGYGPDKHNVEKVISNLALSDQVYFLEFLPPEQLPIAATNFDVGLSLVEGGNPNNNFLIGFKSTDYLCAGIAQLSPDNYVLGRHVLSNNLGFVYKTADVFGFRNALNYLINNGNKIIEWKDSARKLALNDADFDINSMKFCASLNELFHE